MSLRRNISWSFVGNVVFAGSQWGILACLAKLGDVSDVGVYSLALAITAPVFAFTNLQIGQIQATDVRAEFGHRIYFGFRIVTSLVALVVVGLLVTIGPYERPVGIVIAWVALAKVADAVSDYLYGYQLKHEDTRSVALSLVLRGGAGLFSLGVAMVLASNVAVAAASVAIAWSLVSMLFDLRRARSTAITHGETAPWPPSFDRTVFGGLLMTAWPMGVVIMLNVLNLNFPRYFIEARLGQDALGYYSAIAYLLLVGATAINAVGQAGTPRLARYFATDLVAFRRLVFKMQCVALGFGVSSIAIAVVCGDVILGVLYRPEYAKYSHVLVITMVAGLSLYCASIFGCAITAARRFKAQAWSALIVSAVVLASSWVLIPLRGLNGAAESVAVGMAVKLVVQFIQYRYALRLAADRFAVA